MNLPDPKFPREAKVFAEINDADRENLKTNKDNFLGSGSINLTSPGGLIYRIVVDDAGVLSTEQVV